MAGVREVLRRLVSGRKITWFIIILFIGYFSVWLYAMHNQNGASSIITDKDMTYKARNRHQSSHIWRKFSRAIPQKVMTVDRTTNHTRSYHNAPRYLRYTMKPFNPEKPKFAVVLAYQRVGSSFFGKIFDLNSDVFYVYEPLDSLYQAMYGTGSGFNIPSDITSLKNGSDRILPKDEVIAVTEFLKTLFHCQLDNLPTEFFVHSFWYFLPMFMPSWSPYLECLRNANLNRVSNKCASKMKCPKRFGTNLPKSDHCKGHLWTGKEQLRGQSVMTDSKGITSYKRCMEKVRLDADQCIRIMDAKCRGTQLRVTKTVRATMASMEGLIADDDNVRVIHLVRDPRPVAVSRMTTNTYHGLYAGNDTVSEAAVYCSILLRDLRIRHRLEQIYPGTFYEVIYDDFVKHPAKYATHVYNFLDTRVPDALVRWLRKSTRGRTRTNEHRTKYTSKWKRKLTVEQSEHILSHCMEVYKAMAYEFD